MSRDMRVLLVKLADRLHNMRTLGAIQNVAKRQRIAAERGTLHRWPNASACTEMNGELEDLAFTT